MDLDGTIIPHTRQSLDRVFAGWLDRAEREIATLGPEDRREMRTELAEVTTAILRDLGDARGAELVMQAPRSALYQTELGDSAIARGTVTKTLSRTAALEVRTGVLEAAEAIGIERPAMERRLEHPAANAWQEREWVKADLRAVSVARGLDLDVKAERDQVADLVDSFYATAAKVLNQALDLDHSRESDRLVRTLETLSRVHRQHRRVEFEGEDHAERFARDLKERYGERVMEQIASGDDRALASDFPEEGPRRAIARALVAAAESHESLGLSRRQAELARERLLSSEHQHERAQHELRRKDFDLDL